MAPCFMPSSEQKLSRKPMKFASTPQIKILFNNLFLAEALFNYSMLIQGKYATIPVFFSAREYIYHSATATTVPLKTIHNAPAYATEYNNFIQVVSFLLNQQEKSENTEIQNTKNFDFIFELDKLPSLSIKQKITNYFLLKNNPISHFINYRYHKKGKKHAKESTAFPLPPFPPKIKNKSQPHYNLFVMPFD